MHRFLAITRTYHGQFSYCRDTSSRCLEPWRDDLVCRNRTVELVGSEALRPQVFLTSTCLCYILFAEAGPNCARAETSRFRAMADVDRTGFYGPRISRAN